MIRWIVLLLACATSGCVTPYSLKLQPPAATLLPPSHELQSYTSNMGLSQQLERTTAYCGTVKQAVATEIDQRQRHLMIRRTLTVSLSGAAGVGASVYANLATTPDKRVTGTLGAISGGALLMAIPALGTDDRLMALTEKVAGIRAQESSVVQIWNSLGQALLNIALLKQQPTPATDQLSAQYRQTASIEENFRSALATLANACQ